MKTLILIVILLSAGCGETVKGWQNEVLFQGAHHDKEKTIAFKADTFETVCIEWRGAVRCVDSSLKFLIMPVEAELVSR